MKIQCGCGAIYKLSPQMAGKKVKCKKCNSVFNVPATPVAAPTRATPSAAPPQRAPVQQAPVQQAPRRKSAAQQKAEREEALLARYAKSGSQSLDERIASRHKESMESNRVSDAVTHFVVGAIAIAVAIGAFFLMNALEQNGGVSLRIIWVLVMLKGKWWVPPIIIGYGLMRFFQGIYALTRTINAADE